MPGLDSDLLTLADIRLLRKNGAGKLLEECRQAKVPCTAALLTVFFKVDGILTDARWAEAREQGILDAISTVAQSKEVHEVLVAIDCFRRALRYIREAPDDAHDRRLAVRTVFRDAPSLLASVQEHLFTLVRTPDHALRVDFHESAVALIRALMLLQNFFDAESGLLLDTLLRDSCVWSLCMDLWIHAPNHDLVRETLRLLESMQHALAMLDAVQSHEADYVLRRDPEVLIGHLARTLIAATSSNRTTVSPTSSSSSSLNTVLECVRLTALILDTHPDAVHLLPRGFEVVLADILWRLLVEGLSVTRGTSVSEGAMHSGDTIASPSSHYTYSPLACAADRYASDILSTILRAARLSDDTTSRPTELAPDPTSNILLRVLDKRHGANLMARLTRAHAEREAEPVMSKHGTEKRQHDAHSSFLTTQVVEALSALRGPGKVPRPMDPPPLVRALRKGLKPLWGRTARQLAIIPAARELYTPQTVFSFAGGSHPTRSMDAKEDMAAGMTAPCYHAGPDSRPSSATPTSAEASTPTAASTSTTSIIPRTPYELWLELGRLLAAWDEMDGVASVLPSPPPSPSPTSPLLSPPETASSSSSLFTPTPCSSSTPSFTSSSPPPPAFSPPPPSYPPTISSSPFAPPLPILGCSFFLCALSGARTDRRMRACPCGVVQYSRAWSPCPVLDPPWPSFLLDPLLTLLLILFPEIGPRARTERDAPQIGDGSSHGLA